MRGTDPICQKGSLGERFLRGSIRLFQFLYFSIQQKLKRLPENPKTIVFTLDDSMLYRADDGMGRYAYLTLNAFSQAGYNVYLYKKIDFMGYVKLGFYGRFIQHIKNFKVITSLPTNIKDMIYAFDSINPELLSMPWKKFVYVNILKPTLCTIGENIWIPYYFHPHMYRLKQNNRIKELRNQKRVMKVFFGGNTVESYYSNPKVGRNYGQMTRQEGINALYELKDKVSRVQSIKSFLQVLKSNDYINQCWLLETNRCGNTKLNQWFDIISSSDFFMCFSGTDLPMCHNSIESMAVGTIPILSYGDWFFPHLEHKKNAILYSGKEDLKKKIKEVLKMNPEEIARMRRNVVDYYDRYLSNESFISRFEDNHESICTIMLHPRLISNAMEEQNAQEFIKRVETRLERIGISEAITLQV